jgi:uncharacterized membrane protein YagU involved in acid resistance
MSTTTNQSIQAQTSSISTAIKAGAVAGLGGGLVFGVMMGMMGMLPMVGMLAGQESAVVGFIIHTIISAFIGATFGIIAARLPSGWAAAIIGGGVYGIVWWVLGALILMPLMLGMTQMVFAIGGPQWMSLLGHVIYGVVTGILFVSLKSRF